MGFVFIWLLNMKIYVHAMKWLCCSVENFLVENCLLKLMRLMIYESFECFSFEHWLIMVVFHGQVWISKIRKIYEIRLNGNLFENFFMVLKYVIFNLILLTKISVFCDICLKYFGQNWHQYDFRKNAVLFDFFQNI